MEPVRRTEMSVSKATPETWKWSTPGTIVEDIMVGKGQDLLISTLVTQSLGLVFPQYHIYSIWPKIQPSCELLPWRSKRLRVKAALYCVSSSKPTWPSFRRQIEIGQWMYVILGSIGHLCSTESQDLGLPCVSWRPTNWSWKIRNQKQRKSRTLWSPCSCESLIASATQDRGLMLSFQTLLLLDHVRIICDSAKIRTFLRAADKEGLLIALDIQSHNN